MSDLQATFDAYRAEIASLKTRAPGLCESFAPRDFTANQREADRLDEQARGLRRLLPELMRTMFSPADEHEAAADEPGEEEGDN